MSDRYVWISACIALTQLELARSDAPHDVVRLATRLHEDALRTDLPEFQAWALLHLAECGDATAADRARLAAHGTDSPALGRALLTGRPVR